MIPPTINTPLLATAVLLGLLFLYSLCRYHKTRITEILDAYQPEKN